MKMFNCIAFLTCLSAMMIGMAVSYRDNPDAFRLMALLATASVLALIMLVLVAALRRPDSPPAYDPED